MPNNNDNNDSIGPMFIGTAPVSGVTNDGVTWVTVPPTASTVQQPPPVANTLTDAELDDYVSSAQFAKRLHANLETCKYDRVRFVNDGNPNYMQELDRRSVRSFAVSSKALSVKIYNQSYLYSSIDAWMASKGWVVNESISPDHYYAKDCMVTAITGLDYKPGVALKDAARITDQHPAMLTSYCIGCKDLYSCQYLCNTARTGTRSLHDRIGPVDRPFVEWRKYNGRSVCECCLSDTERFARCARCDGIEERGHMTSLLGGRQAVCGGCFEEAVSEQCFFENTFQFQPVRVEMPEKLLHVGCEFECYISPKTKIPSFDKKHVFQVKRDGSLISDNLGIAIELVTQPLLDWRTEAITHICKELKTANVRTDATCGGHVHVDARGIDLSDRRVHRLRDLFRIYEAAFYAIVPRARLRSRYSSPVELINPPGNSRYLSLNLRSLGDHGTMEFRCFDGSSDKDVWLSRIALSEGFVNFAKSQIAKYSEVVGPKDALKDLTGDGGYTNWSAVLSSYDVEGERSGSLATLIKAKGPALINLAATRFGLKTETIKCLVSQHETYWKDR